MSKIYTPQIIEYTQNVINVLSEKDEKGDNFFEVETFRDPKLGRKILYELIADTATENFLQREDQDIILTQKQFEEVFKLTIVKVSAAFLEKIGLVVSFEDENGEECIALSEKGKQTVEDVKQTIENTK